MNMVLPFGFITLFTGVTSPVWLRGTRLFAPVTVLLPYDPYSQSLAQS
ncbi:hypothetical protein M2400_004691 [Pseudomonas sp. BIGb0558]|nr:hypothetical protein [Pseudomonas sp. BIGb0558]